MAHHDWKGRSRPSAYGGRGDVEVHQATIGMAKEDELLAKFEFQLDLVIERGCAEQYPSVMDQSQLPVVVWD